MHMPFRQLWLAPAVLVLPAITSTLAETRPPVRFSWTPQVVAMLPAELGEDLARVRTTRATLDVGGLWTVSNALDLALETGVGYTHYRFREFGVILNGIEPPIRDGFTARLAPKVIYRLDPQWTLFGGIGASANGDAAADMTDAVVGIGYVGARRQFNERFALNFGVYGSTRLEDDPRVIPMVGVEWQLSKKWRLASQGTSGQLSYQIKDPLRLFLGLGFEFRDFRLDDDSSIPEGVLRDESIPISLGLEWTPNPAASVTLQAGRAFARSLEILDRSGVTQANEDVLASTYLSLAIKVGFVADADNGGEKNTSQGPELMEPRREGLCRGSVFQIWEENDSVTGTDHAYTQGLRVSWLAREHSIAESPAWLRWFAEGLPAFGYEVDRARFAISLGQNIYAPQDISLTTWQPDQRPYAATLYAAPALQRRGKNERGNDVLEELRIDLGWIGPGALGGEAQNFIHRNWGIAEAYGWQNQVRNEPTASVSLARALRVLVGGNRERGAVEWIPHTAVQMGTPRTMAAAGSTLRIGLRMPDDFGQPTIRSTLPSSGSGYNSGFGVHLFAAIEGRAITHNSTIDGNLWKSSNSQESMFWGIEGRLGVAVTWRRVDVGFTYTYESREFVGQEHNHTHGSLWLNWRI